MTDKDEAGHSHHDGGTAGGTGGGADEGIGAGVDEGSIVLDIGGDVGALIVHTDESLHRVEIEISPDDESGEDVFQAEHPHVHTHEPHTHEPHTHEPHTHEPHTHEDGHTHAHTPGTTHVAVLRRQGPGGIGYAAVYPGLREGDYTLWNADHTPADTVHIVGGTVVELDWRGR